ncbi:MAG: hypothetical protein QW314_05770 [Thermoproteota archaeon]|nr:hypothetical protein [Candidatus Brockarchaeota archaeon]
MCPDVEKFEQDIESFVSKLSEGESEGVKITLIRLSKKLKRLKEKGLVKINHSILELACAKYYYKLGYEVDVEYPVNGLSCDILGVRGDGRLIVEVETGFVPPEGALTPTEYTIARISSKIARYSQFAHKFALGTPSFNLLLIPKLFMKPPRNRKPEEINTIKKICDVYYRNPPISYEQIANARLHSICIIDADDGFVKEVSSEAYFEVLNLLSSTFMLKL